MSTYYDIDAILTDAQKLPCTFEFQGPSLGFLDGNTGEDIKPGTKVELPLWLAEFLAVPTRPGAQPLLTLDTPASLRPNSLVLNALKASPTTVDLRSQCPHFFSLAARILELFEGEDVVDVLLDVSGRELWGSKLGLIIFQTFKKRAGEIGDHARNARGGITGGGGGGGEATGVEFLRGLDETERALFKAMHEGDKGVRAWLKGWSKQS